MTEKELKKLNRYQLLELLVMQTERADALEKTIGELQAKLEERELRFSQMGSIAEASVYLSGVLDAAQAAADLYLESVKKQADALLEEARAQADSILVQAEEEVRSRAAAVQPVQAEGKRKVNEKGKSKRKSSKNRRTKK